MQGHVPCARQYSEQYSLTIQGDVPRARQYSEQYSLTIQGDVPRARQYSEQYSLTTQVDVPRARQYSYTASVLGIVKALVECLWENNCICSVAYLNHNSVLKSQLLLIH